MEDHRSKRKSADHCAQCTLKFRFSLPKLSPTKYGQGKIPSRLPKILKCGHIVCNACLEIGLKSTPIYRCPVCDKSHDYANNLEEIPTNCHVIGHIMLDEASGNDPTKITFDNLTNGSVNEHGNCPKHSEEQITLKCVDCRPTVSICDKCHKEGHSSHFVENLSNDDMQDLVDIKKDEMTQMFRDLRRYFDVQHSFLQLFEEEKKREIIKVYEERIKAIDPTKPLKNTCMNELREKSWVKVDLPSTLVNMGCHPKTLQQETEIRKDIIPRILPIRYEKETSDQMRNVNLSNDESQQDEAVKIVDFGKSTPSDFFVHRVQDLDAIENLHKRINQKHSQNALTVLESMEPGDKVLIPKRKRNIRFEGSEQNEKLVLRAEVLEASEFSITVRFLDYGSVQEYSLLGTDIYFPDQEFFDDKTYPMFAIRCKLFNIIPATTEEDMENANDVSGNSVEEWSEAGTCHFNLLSDRTLYARVMKAEKSIDVVDLYMKKPLDTELTWVSDHLVFMGNASYENESDRHVPGEKSEKYRYTELDENLFGIGSTHLVLFTCFGQDQNGNYGDLDQSFERLSFQVLLGPDGTEYCKDLSRLLISMEKRYNKDEKYDPDLLIDYPRKGQVCAVLHRRSKEQKEDQCFRGLIVDIWPGKPSLLDESLNLENSKSSKNELLDNRYPLVQVYFVDEGNLEWKYLSEVRMLPIEALQLPKLAIKATLSDIVPEPSKTKAAMQKFDQLCKAKHLWMSVDAKVDAQQPLKVVIYEENSYKRININALLVWEGCAQPKDDNVPFCKRVEYFNEDPLKMLLKDDGNKKLPIYSNANITKNIDASQLVSGIRVVNVITGKKGNVLVLTGPNSFDPEILDLEETIKNELSELSDTLDSDTDMIQMQIGELCVLENATENSFRRARIQEMTEDNSEVVSVICIDKGTIEKVTDDDRIRPLYSQFRTNLENTLVPYKLRGVQINDTNGCDMFKQALSALIKGSNLYLLKKTETNSVIQAKTNIANVNLSLWEESAPEIDLICEISCNMGPFSDGTKYFFDVGILLSEMGVCKLSNVDLLPAARRQNSVKLQWLNPILPSDSEYRNLRMVACDTTICDFEAIITSVDEKGNIWLEDWNSTLGARSNLNSQIEAVYLFSKPKWQDTNWYIGEPCIAQFWWDKSWNRAVVVEILDSKDHFANVQFVDYGNIAPVTRDQLRKDLVGLEIPVLSFPVVLHGIKITSGFKAHEVHVQFQNSPVRVELKSPPSQIPHEVNIYFENTTYSEDLASILVTQNMATRI